MSLAPGARLGPYEILAPIGAGGMGEVYRARDGKLNRDVALKILPDTFATDLDRLARFKREAQVLATLNHPNIGHIYGLEDSPSTGSGQAAHPPALVLELIEGPTLADRIAEGPIPLEEALPIAKQIADALEAAHEHGIVHRDLKPANVKVKDDGTVKVLDFGLAKALDPTASSSAEALNSPTLTFRATQMGQILGTAAYMSPEQAKGKAVDRRADIWAFGAVLYEMLTGTRAFEGEDISDTLAAVLRQDVKLGALPAETPAAVRRLIARCLERDVRRRLRDIGEARIVLENPEAEDSRSDVSAAIVSATVPARPRWRRVMPAVLSAIVAAALAGTAAWYAKPTAPVAVARFAFTLPDGQAFSGLTRHLLAISADGAHIAYAANGRLYLRSMAELDAKPLQGTESYQNPFEPVFSPDGRSIAFFAVADQTIKRVGVSGGTPVTICQAEIPFGISWGPDGIVFGQGLKGIMRVSSNGGTPEVLYSVKADQMVHGPQMLPGGRHAMFTLAGTTGPDRWDKGKIVVLSLASGELTTIIDGGTDARYLPTGHIVYAIGGSVFAVTFDVKRMQVKGSSVPVIDGVRRAIPPATGAASFSVSDNGTLVYVPGPVSASLALQDIALVDRKGVVQPLKLPTAPYSAPRVSPDGKRIAVGSEDKDAFIAIYDLDGRTAMRRLTFGGNNRFPIWTSDGNRVTFQSDRDSDRAIYWQPAEGGTAERLTRPNQGEDHVPNAWSPQGDVLLFDVVKGSDVSLWVFSLRDKKPTPFNTGHSPNPTNAVFSPDGSWVAYASNDSGRSRTYVEPFPPTGARYEVPARPTDGPHEGVWSRDGHEIFYNPRPGGFESVSVTTKPVFGFGNPVALPRPFILGPPTARTSYDITPAGKFVAMIQPGVTESGTSFAQQIHVVFNWFQELKQRTSAQ